MKELIQKCLSDFSKFPILIQAILVSSVWIFLFLTCDAWFSPFFFKGYQLIFYLFIVTVLSSWLAHWGFFTLLRSPVTWNWVEDRSRELSMPCRRISLKDISDRELSGIAKNAAESIVTYLDDDSHDSEDFVREIHSQVEDIFQSLSLKLSRIRLEDFIQSIIQILHCHLQSYLKTVTNKDRKPILSHPVSKGEIPLEVYLDGLSHAIMKEFIPGSIQDCSAIFDLSCAAFCNQLLLKFVHGLSQPETVLQSLLQMLESSGMPIFDSGADLTDFSRKSQLSEHQLSSSFVKDSRTTTSPAVESAIENEDIPLSGSSPQSGRDEVNDALGSVNFCSMRRNSSPVLAGNLMTSSHLITKSCIETGLCSSLSAITAPLLPSNNEELASVPSSKPSSLPLVRSSEASDGQSATGSTDTDVSPVYEEVEDFASAIAKLRSLLEQRNVVDSPVTRNAKDVSSPLSDMKNYSSSGDGESSFEELIGASELPNDNRIFLNIKIPRSELCTVSGEGQHSVYHVTYEGIYTAVSSGSAIGVEDGHKESRLVLKSRTVRRRFRQFVQLHEQLKASEDPSISLAIRSIRGPSKWLNLPFSRLDQNTTLHRQSFLERYMSSLVNSIPISTSIELRQFLDYEANLNEANATPSNVAFQRVPFFGRTVSGVLQSIKTALPLPIPGFETDQCRSVQLLPLPPPSPHPSASADPSSMQAFERDAKYDPQLDELDGRVSPGPCRIVYSGEEGKLEQLLSSWNQHLDCRVESAYEAFESHLWRSELNIQADQTVHEADAPIKFSAASSRRPSNSDTASWDRFDDELPLSSSVINLLIECLGCRETWLTKAPVTLAIKIIVGQRMEKTIQESLYQFSDPDQLAGNLRRFKKKLSAKPDVTMPTLESKDVDGLVMEVVRLLEKRLPGLVTRFVGETLSTDVLKTVVSCFSDAQRNRDLALTLLDFFFAQISSLGDVGSIRRPVCN